jgi:phospholipid-binding lipoprotein MlaA
VGDSFLTPVNYLNPFELVTGIRVYDRLNRTSLEIGDYEDLIGSSLEPYISVKDAYFQHRHSLLGR